MSNKQYLQELADEFKAKPDAIKARLVFLGYSDTCTRCHGVGEYSYNAIHGKRCYGCWGAGKGLKRLTKTDLKTFRERVAAGELKPYFDRIAAMQFIKAIRSKVFEVWGGTNISKLHNEYWNVATTDSIVSLRNSEMFKLQDKASKITDKYLLNKNIDLSNAVADKAEIQVIIEQIKALDISMEELTPEVNKLMEAKRLWLEELEGYRQARLAKKQSGV